MNPLEKIIFTALKNNNVTLGKPKLESKFRLEYTTNSLNLTEALLAQLDRYAEANPITPMSGKNKGKPVTMPRSKVVRKAIKNLLVDNPHLINYKPKLPVCAPDIDRTKTITWTMPRKSAKQMHEYLTTTAKNHYVSLSTMTRRAIYIHTKAYVSTDKDEAHLALCDGWF
jgi:hypothetical protein